MPSCVYGRTIPVEVCTDGPVGGGDSSDMSVKLTDGGLVSGGMKILTKTNWNGSSTSFNNWVDFFPDCAVNGSSMTVTLGPGTDEVTISISVTVSSCNTFGTTYSNCGGPGPHTLTDTKTVPLNVGGACSFAVGP